MAKWTALLATLKQKNYSDASKELDVIQDYDDLQDALQVIPFKTLNQDLPGSLSILEKLYTKFITLTNDKEEGRLIIRQVFKVDVLLKNIIRVQVEDGVLGGTGGLSKDSVDQITQITWNTDSTIVKELMSRLNRLNSTFRHFQKSSPTALDVSLSVEDIKMDVKCCLAKFNSVVRHLECFIKGGTTGDSKEYSKIELASYRETVEQIRRRCSLNQAVLDVMEPCRGNIDRGPVLLQSLEGLVRDDMKFLEIMTELSSDISSACYADTSLEKILEIVISSYKTVLSAVATVSEPPLLSVQRCASQTMGEKDTGLVNHGLKIDVNGSPFRRRFVTRRFSNRDERERKEPLRTHSYRQPRSGELSPISDYASAAKEEPRLKEKLALKEKQLEETRSLVKNLKKREEQLLEKLTEQAKNHLKNSEKFENISQDIPRVDHLVKEYDDLYSQLRLDALDDLDNIDTFDSLERSDEIKSQITFAVITVSFHLAQREIENRRAKIFSLLNMDETSLQNGEYASLRNEISLQLRRSVSKMDLEHVVNEVCNGLCSTMFDFPEMKSCEQLRRFVEACVRFSSSICVHVPPLTINYESTNFTPSLHSKSHNSNHRCEKVRYHVWPALIESENKTVLYKGVVTT